MPLSDRMREILSNAPITGLYVDSPEDILKQEKQKLEVEKLRQETQKEGLSNKILGVTPDQLFNTGPAGQQAAETNYRKNMYGPSSQPVQGPLDQQQETNLDQMKAQVPDLQKTTGLPNNFGNVPLAALDTVTKASSELATANKKAPGMLSYNPKTGEFMATANVPPERKAEFLNELTPSEVAAEATKHQENQNSANSREQQHQDLLEEHALNRLSGIRGDPSLKRVEEQRDAAISAITRLNEIKSEGKQPNPVDYVDILGQIYKARTGSAPTNEVLSQAKQETAGGNFNKWYTFFTGNQAPATSQNIADSLQNTASSMGRLADKLHDSYMTTHGIKPTGLEDERWNNVKKSQRGMSFAEATASPNPNQPQTVKPMTATNKATGQKIQSSDGGKTWQPLTQ